MDVVLLTKSVCLFVVFLNCTLIPGTRYTRLILKNMTSCMLCRYDARILWCRSCFLASFFGIFSILNFLLFALFTHLLFWSPLAQLASQVVHWHYPRVAKITVTFSNRFALDTRSQDTNGIFCDLIIWLLCILCSIGAHIMGC